jgi:hypothetical protein
MKLATLDDAIDAFVPDGASVAIGMARSGPQGFWTR